MYLISDYFSFVAGNAARGTVHEHATFRGSPHIYSRRTITLTATNNQYIVDFDVFMDLLRETRKMWESKLSLGRNIYRCFLFFLCIYLYFLLRKSGLNLFLSVCGARKWRQSETPSLLFWNPHVFYCHGSRLCWWLWVYDAARLHELFCVMHTDHRPVLTVTFSLNCLFHKGHFVKKSTQNKRTRQWFKHM